MLYESFVVASNLYSLSMVAIGVKVITDKSMIPRHPRDKLVGAVMIALGTGLAGYVFIA